MIRPARQPLPHLLKIETDLQAAVLFGGVDEQMLHLEDQRP